MPQVQINIPDHLEMQIVQMVEEGEFVSREDAVEELLTTGLKAVKTSGQINDEEEPEFTETEDMMGHDDEYVF